MQCGIDGKQTSVKAMIMPSASATIRLPPARTPLIDAATLSTAAGGILRAFLAGPSRSIDRPLLNFRAALLWRPSYMLK